MGLWPHLCARCTPASVFVLQNQHATVWHTPVIRTKVRERHHLVVASRIIVGINHCNWRMISPQFYADLCENSWLATESRFIIRLISESCERSTLDVEDGVNRAHVNAWPLLRGKKKRCKTACFCWTSCMHASDYTKFTTTSTTFLLPVFFCFRLFKLNRQMSVKDRHSYFKDLYFILLTWTFCIEKEIFSMFSI